MRIYPEFNIQKVLERLLLKGHIVDVHAGIRTE